MIKFTKIRYKNLLSVGNKFIEIDLGSFDKTLMVGKNGQGKSLLADALTFALYGKAFRKIKKEQMVNAVNAKGLLVELEFSVGSNDYIIKRGIKPNVFEIYINGKLKNQDSNAKDYQSYLEQNIVGISEKTFRQIVILGSTAFVPFMKLTAADRRAVVENLLDIQVFSYMQQIVKGRASTLQNKYRDLKNQIDLLDNTLELKERHIQDLKNRDVEKAEHNKTLIKKYESEIDNLRGLIAKVNDEITALQNVPVDDTVDKKLSSLNELRIKIETNVGRYNQDLRFYGENSECPTCQQAINHELKEAKVSENTTKINQAQEGLTKIQEEISKCVDYISEVNSRLTSINALQLRINEFNGQISTNKRLIDTLVDSNSKLDSLDTSNEEAEILELNTKINNLTTIRSELIEEGNYYSVILSMVKDDGIKAKIIKSYIPIINKLIKKYLKILDFSVDFVFDEQFNETIRARNRDVFSYANFSEGEKLRIDLCLLFTWREIARMKNSASTNLILFDEIGSNSLDVDGVDAFMRIISDEEDQNVFVISHNPSMEDRFNQILTFKKVGDFTRMNVK